MDNLLKDPVCGMSPRDEFKTEYKGKLIYFCSDHCRTEFQGFPERYLDKTSFHATSEDNKLKTIAYFSMEIGVDARIPTYSGGLGVLAGDTIKACADLKVPMVAVTILYEKGYFRQKLDSQGNQQELPVEWNPRDFLKPLPNRVSVKIEGRDVIVGAWQFDATGVTGYCVPIIFLDTDLPENSEYDRSLNNSLYAGDQKHRLAQEIILGIAGVRMLESLGYTGIKRYHMNEGHASLLTLELLNTRKNHKDPWDFEGIRELCVFTTHTPVPAGHDQFSYELVTGILGEFIPLDVLKMLGGEERLNMTLLALNLSRYINGVAKRHGEISQAMFPEYQIESITNGVHSHTWTCESFKKLFDKYIPGWANDPFSLRYALNIPKIEIWAAHAQAKKKLIDYLNTCSTIGGFDYGALTIGFARRAATYKRADMVFFDINRLAQISSKIGRIQFIFGGKAHPKDQPGKELIKRIFANISQLRDKIKIVYLQDYDIDLAKMLISGVDLWLNTPQRPNEASGTSGMKAAHNGIPSLSVLDGWWLEGHIEDLTGWSIGPKTTDSYSDSTNDSQDLYEKLETKIVPMFYNDRDRWVEIMQHSIAINASFFNTHRMVQQYVLNSYLY